MGEVVPIAEFSRGQRAGRAELDNLALGLPLRVRREPITTGFGDLDMVLGGTEDRLGGLLPGEFTVLGADTGIGKSSFCEQLAIAAAATVPVTYFALEMGRERTVERLIAKMADLDHKSVQNLLVHRADHPRIGEGMRRLAEDVDLIVEERIADESFTIGHVEAIARANCARLIIIDDLQSLDGWNEAGRNSHAENVGIVKRLVRFAQEQSCHVFLPHQLVKNWRKSPKQRPSRHDLADCAALARLADAVLMLHRPFRGEGPRDRVVEIVADKNRNGPECVTHLERIGAKLSFRELGDHEVRDLGCCKPGGAR